MSILALASVASETGPISMSGKRNLHQKVLLAQHVESRLKDALTALERDKTAALVVPIASQLVRARLFDFELRAEWQQKAQIFDPWPPRTRRRKRARMCGKRGLRCVAEPFLSVNFLTGGAADADTVGSQHTD
ncbi:hypothetical protein DFJ73DRAFT_961553 [Zopfochytrium polystomum]|nr:hypothetical protein DFJ73DRAFT_961553 [Zopfochytrium polystomum]